VRVVGEILQEVRLLFSSVGRGRGAGAGMNDVLAHLDRPLDKRGDGCGIIQPVDQMSQLGSLEIEDGGG
jgi:acetylornithine deacetylase/succinyl-diaminopimelate desuccinylase-like protein